MQTVDIAATTGTSASTGVARPVSAGWLIRRMALWMLFVGLGIAGSCLLYMAASQAEAESLSRDQAAVTRNAS